MPTASAISQGRVAIVLAEKATRHMFQVGRAIIAGLAKQTSDGQLFKDLAAFESSTVKLDQGSVPEAQSVK